MFSALVLTMIAKRGVIVIVESLCFDRELQGCLTIGTALYKVENDHVWLPLLDLKKSFPEVSYRTHTHVIFGVCLDSGLTMQEFYEPWKV